ncbi:efflux RND transporter periplasmic adaptor subunit [Nitrogeniibacter aestuarii]|uniref:efflux RND transporter periplasmic adaptor subunit n=1 Tax=Nitrogeniibacter aestuarii TaxID=2815343 RepID=UPI001D0FAC2E|nr:efflux RND transporter periplasmic adaptor subunit [Nitrogeniibacter aestuarii]
MTIAGRDFAVRTLLLLLLLTPLWAQAAELSVKPLRALVSFPAFRASATANPLYETQLAFAVDGHIARMQARVGETVEQGQTLAQLDDREYRIGLDQAKAQLALVRSQITLAESQLAQSESLAKQKFVSPDALKIKRTELAVRRAERDAARQAVAAAELDLERALLRAPFRAVVQARQASVGDYVSAGEVVFALAAVAEPEIRAGIPVQQVPGLKAAEQWTLAAAGMEIPLKLLRVSAVVDTTGQTQEAVFAPLRQMPIGLAGEVRWQGNRALLPPGYVQRREGRYGVFVMDGKAPVFRELPDAQAGRPAMVPASWPLDLPVVDEGRYQIGLEKAGDAVDAGSSQ